MQLSRKITLSKKNPKIVVLCSFNKVKSKYLRLSDSKTFSKGILIKMPCHGPCQTPALLLWCFVLSFFASVIPLQQMLCELVFWKIWESTIRAQMTCKRLSLWLQANQVSCFLHMALFWCHCYNKTIWNMMWFCPLVCLMF